MRPAGGGRATGNAGLTAVSPPPAWPGFRLLAVTALDRESDSVVWCTWPIQPGPPCRRASPGQFLTLRLNAVPGRPAAAAQLFTVRSAGLRCLPDQRQA